MKLCRTRLFLMGVALAALPGLRVLAQDHEHEHSDEAQSLEQVHQRMRDLMVGVEKRLKSIDELLNEASAREKLAAGGSKAVSEVLTKSRDDAHQNIEDIDEILRLSLHPHPSTGAGGAGGT